MSQAVDERLHERIHEHLSTHGSDSLRAQLASVVDLKAIDAKQYQEVLDTVNSRLKSIRYSLISMLVAGIYFGLLVGTWLVDTSSLESILLWGVPALLVTIYGIYSTSHMLRESYHLSEARSLLYILTDRSLPDR